MPEDLMTSHELARYLKVDLRTVYRYLTAILILAILVKTLPHGCYFDSIGGRVSPLGGYLQGHFVGSLPLTCQNENC